MSTTDPRTENFPLAAEGREALEAASRGNRPLTPTERVIASVEADTPQEASGAARLARYFLSCARGWAAS